MPLKLNNNKENTLSIILEKLKVKFPNYTIECGPTKNGEKGLVKINKRYWIVLKRQNEKLTIYCDIQGILFYLLPEILILIFMPDAKKYEKFIISEIKSILNSQTQ